MGVRKFHRSHFIDRTFHRKKIFFIDFFFFFLVILFKKSYPVILTTSLIFNSHIIHIFADFKLITYYLINILLVETIVTHIAQQYAFYKKFIYLKLITFSKKLWIHENSSLSLKLSVYEFLFLLNYLLF